MQDDALADRLARLPQAQGKESKPVRRMSDWSVTVELLSSILNRLGELTQAVAALGGAKPHKITPAPVPQTAMDRARNRRRFDNHRRLVARVLPQKRTNDPPSI